MKETSRKPVKTTAAPSGTNDGGASAMLKQPIPWEFLVTSSDDAIMAKSPDGFITSWNPAAEKIYGYSSKEILGQHVSVLIPPSHSDEFAHLLEKIKRGERINHFETERKRKDGGLVDVALTVSPINDPAGRLIGISTIARDITGRKRTSQYARSLIEASLDPLVTISPDGKITDVNDATVKVTGVSRAELIGSDFSTYFTEPEKAREGYRQVFAQGFVADYPLTIRHRAGTLTDVLYNASVYKDARGNVLGVFAAARDVTAQKRAERELAEQRQKELVRLADLERFQRLTVGRELKMIELKKEIEELKRNPARPA